MIFLIFTLVFLLISVIMLVICMIKPIYCFVFCHTEWKIWKTILNHVDSFKETASYQTASLYQSESLPNLYLYIWNDKKAGVFNDKKEVLANSFIPLSDKVIKKLK